MDRSPSFNPLKKQKQNYDIGEIHSLAHLSVLSVQERLDVFNGLPSTSNSSRKGYEIIMEKNHNVKKPWSLDSLCSFSALSLQKVHHHFSSKTD